MSKTETENQTLSTERDKAISKAVHNEGKVSEMNLRRHEAVMAAEQLEDDFSLMRTKYRVLFYCMLANVFFLAVAFLVQHSTALHDFQAWIFACGDIIRNVCLSVASIFVAVVNGIERFLRMPVLISYLVASILFLTAACLVGLGVIHLRPMVRNLIARISSSYRDRQLKRAISVEIVINLFILCVCFDAQLKAVLARVNIVNVWLLLSAIFILIWNFPEIKGGLRH